MAALDPVPKSTPTSEIKHDPPTQIENSKTIDQIFKDSNLATPRVQPERVDTHVVFPDYFQLYPEARRLYHVLPPLGGPYPVGYSNLVIENPNNEVGDSKVGIEIYAPTRNSLGPKLLMRLNPGHPIEQELSPEQLKSLTTHSTDHLDPIQPMPLIIFSHGCGCNPSEYRPLLEELASHGFAVIGLNHPSSSSFAPFTEQKMAEFREDDRPFNAKLIQELASKQAANIAFVLDQIRQGDLSEMIQNLGTQEQIVLVGHSLGGAASVLATRDDPQIAGCINLDGQLFGDESIRSKGLQTPVLAIYSEHIPRPVDHPGYHEEQQIFKEWDEFHATCADSYREILKGTDHLDFTVIPLLGWVGGIDDMEGPSKEGAERAFSITSQRITSFMINLK